RWLLAQPGEAARRRATRDLEVVRADATRAVVTRPAIAAILRSRGGVRIADLALELGIHRRRLERAFARDLGIRPKLFARIVRLNAALAKLDPAERGRAVDWALDAGYFDQAHLSREFRTITGRRAGASRDADGEMARHFTDPRRLAAYLSGE
ncbi:MAG: helix-turn-helix domain-containing protein, partial [bacterium]